MALTTYTQIQDSIRRYLWDRNDLAGQIPDFIALCEARLNDTLRVSQMETSASITLTSGSGSLPSDYLAYRRVLTQDSPVRDLQLAGPAWADHEYPDTASGLADFFTIAGTTLKTYPPSSSNVTLYYYQKIPALASNTTGNWVTSRSPGLYIYGSLIEASPALDDDPRAQTWALLFKESVDGLQRADTAHRYNRVNMRVRGYMP